MSRPGAPDLLAGAKIVAEDAGSPAAAPTSPGGPAAIDASGEALVPPPPQRLLDTSRLRLYGGGLLVGLCLTLFGWNVWRGREPAPITIRAASAGPGAEIRVQVSGAVATPGVYRLLQGDRVEDAVRAAGGLAPDADASRLNLAQRVRDEQRLEVPFVRQPSPTVPPANAATEQQTPDLAAVVTPPAQPADAVAEVAATPRSTRTPRAAQTAKPAPTSRATTTPKPEPTARPSATSRPTEAAQRADGRVNVNTATAAQLEKLPGIGEVSAQRIVAYREANGPIRSLEQLRQAGISDAILRRAADYLAFDQ
jgi:competence protein ComEA